MNVIDDLVRRAGDGLTVGIPPSASHNERVVRYALRSVNTPMAVAGNTHGELPAEVRDAMPENTAHEATVRSALDDVERHSGDERTDDAGELRLEPGRFELPQSPAMLPHGVSDRGSRSSLSDGDGADKPAMLSAKFGRTMNRGN